MTAFVQHQTPQLNLEIADPAIRRQLAYALKEYWGFDSFRPLQLPAMNSVLCDQDSLVVFPTGGGKSLCFQAPALCREGLAVVVSPLISLMKDQVDALQTCGVAAACLNSTVTGQRQNEILARIERGELRLLYLAPERLLMERTRDFLQSIKVSFFAVDEAHCVSEWGHDFRPDYRALCQLKGLFPGVAIHAYTATATEQVRNDITLQLKLKNPRTLVGPIDRPNLNYQIRQRDNGLAQIATVLEQHKNESGIIYCISRKDVESTSAALNALGFSTLPYHAGMSDSDRKRHQEAFLREETDTIVATVAFGMGIDKSNVRYVVHAAMPKSLEGYQQESGRAGRDGLPADCWMFYRDGDYATWKRLLSQSDSVTGRAGAMRSLQAMSEFCHGIRCRHAALSRYFGQSLEKRECEACDVCLGSLTWVDDGLIVGQKILSCVARVQQRFGGEYVAQVLTGSRDRRILENGHDQLSTYALMAENDKRTIRRWIEQLVSQKFLARVGEYDVLQITEAGRRLLRGELTPRLASPNGSSSSGGERADPESWLGVDRGLFDRLRELRTLKSVQLSVPAYVIFSDATLRDMARRRPSTKAALHVVNGVGQQKLEDFGEAFLKVIVGYCQSAGLELDVEPPATSHELRSPRLNKSAIASFEHFAAGKSVTEVAKLMGRAESTARGYLCQYIQVKRITDATAWVEEPTVRRVQEAIHEHGLGPLRPIYLALGEKVGYDEIRIVMCCMANEV